MYTGVHNTHMMTSAVQMWTGYGRPCLRLTASFLTSWRGSKMTVPGYRDIHRNTSFTSCT